VPAPSPYAALLDEIPQTVNELDLLGSRTRYWTYGAAESAVTIVIVHGYRGEHHGLEPVIAQLRDVRVIAPDLPGFGESTPMTDAHHDIEGYRRWLGEFVRALGLGADAVVLGHSFGSIIVAHAVARGNIVPERIVLINPIAALPSGPVKATGTAALIGAHRLAGRFGDRIGTWLIGNRAVVRGMSLGMAVTRDPVLRRWIHAQHDAYFSDFAGMDTVLEAFAASVSNTVTEVAADVTARTLLIGAEQDQIAPATAVVELADRMPDSTLRMIPGVGHLIHYETPYPAARYLVEFLGAGRLALDSR
jgi:pimeloyl-ACP methyl ester carboxylesterase